MSPLGIVAMVLGYGVAAALSVAVHGWRRGLVLFVDILCWSLVVLGGPRLVEVVAGELASWCSLPVFAAATWFGRTPLGMLNFLVLQWFGVRLQAATDTDEWLRGPRGRWWSSDAPSNGPVEWSLRRWILPLTGWWSSYWGWWSSARWIGRQS